MSSVCGAGKAKSFLARHEINRLLESKGVHKNHSNVGWKLGLGLRIIKLPTVQLRTFSYFHNSFRCKCCPHNFVLDYPQSCPLVVTDSYKCKRRNYSFVNLQTDRQTENYITYDDLRKLGWVLTIFPHIRILHSVSNLQSTFSHIPVRDRKFTSH